MNSYEALREKKKNASVLITTCRWLPKLNFTAPKMLEFLILNWGEWLTQTEQLIDRGPEKNSKERKVNLSLQVANIQHKDYILYPCHFLSLTWQET